MDINDLINKKKLKCDNIMSIAIIVGILILFVFFRLIIFVSLMVYPLSSLFINGILYVYKVVVKKDRETAKRVLRFIVGIFYLAFSAFMLGLIFSYPHITLSYIIYFLSIPLFFVGFAAILKGSIVVVYSPLFRRLNIATGILTIGICFMALYFAEAFFVLSLISLLLVFTLNGFLRSGLYLSEYGLSIRNLKNIRYVFYIMDNLHVVNLEEEAQR